MKKRRVVNFTIGIVICCLVAFAIGVVIDNAIVIFCGLSGFVCIIIGIVGGSYDETGNPLDISDLKVGSLIEVLSEGHSTSKDSGDNKSKEHVYIIQLQDEEICSLNYNKVLHPGKHAVTEDGLKNI